MSPSPMQPTFTGTPSLLACPCLRMPALACACLRLPALACACLRLPALACACLRLPALACACLHGSIRRHVALENAWWVRAGSGDDACMTTPRSEPAQNADERTMLEGWLDYHRQ